MKRYTFVDEHTRPVRMLHGLALFDEKKIIDSEECGGRTIFRADDSQGMCRFHNGKIFLGYIHVEHLKGWTFHAWLGTDPARGGMMDHELTWDRKRYYLTEERAIAAAERFLRKAHRLLQEKEKNSVEG